MKEIDIINDTSDEESLNKLNDEKVSENHDTTMREPVIKKRKNKLKKKISRSTESVLETEFQPKLSVNQSNEKIIK